MILALALLFGCPSSGDAELVPVRSALEEWREGVEALEQGEPEAARIAFQDARRHQPNSPLLLAWEATATAGVGELAAAVELLDRALMRDPRLVTARYNRAAYLARMGMPELAGPELERALAGGVMSPRQAAADPDFEPYLGHTAFSFLPDRVLAPLGVEGPAGPVFLGSEFRIAARIAGADERAIGITAEALHGPAVLTGAEETLLDSTDGLVRELVWTWRAEGPGTFTVGPLIATVGERSTSLPAVVVELLAPPDATGQAVLHEARLPTPLEYGFGAVPRALVAGEDLVVVITAGDRVEIDPKPEGQPQTFVYSERDRPQYRALRWVGEGTSSRQVTVVRRGSTLLEVALKPGE
ncbi:MAG: hypothetical protein KC912_06610 [Proteobacteria bacterium]|nr:hypothetical protein [Pseudomonadota bacterium]